MKFYKMAMNCEENRLKANTRRCFYQHVCYHMLHYNTDRHFEHSTWIYQAQVTPVIRAFVIRVFAYQRFYFSITRSINTLSAATAETAAQVHCYCAHRSTDSSQHFESSAYKLRPLVVCHSERPRACYAFPFLHMVEKGGDSQKRSPEYTELYE
jgi:hypothetical protein